MYTPICTHIYMTHIYTQIHNIYSPYTCIPNVYIHYTHMNPQADTQTHECTSYTYHTHVLRYIQSHAMNM